MQDELNRVFYSEDDFQHELAWAIHNEIDAEVRIEREHLKTDRGKE